MRTCGDNSVKNNIPTNVQLFNKMNWEPLKLYCETESEILHCKYLSSQANVSGMAKYISVELYY